MHSKERQRTVAAMTCESARALGVVVKCSICLALLTLVLVIGSVRENDGATPEAGNGAPHAAAVAMQPSAAAHRKAVFDDRRARLAGNASERTLAETAPAASVEAYAP